MSLLKRIRWQSISSFQRCWNVIWRTNADVTMEMKYSETTFILSEKWENGCDVRIFTPEKKFPCWYPAFGTAYVIQREIIRKPIKTIILNLKSGQIPVTRENDILWVRQKPPVFGKILESNQIAQVLNIDKRDIDQFPIQRSLYWITFHRSSIEELRCVKESSNWQRKVF